MEVQLLLVLLIVFVAALTRSTFGFGEALVAMPLLSMVIDVKSAAALIAMTSIFNAVVILASDPRTIEWQSAWRLVVAALLGVPVGVYGLTHLPEQLVKTVLAVLVISFSLYNLLRPRLYRFHTDGPAFGFGLVAGVLGGAYNTLGPPLVIFGTLRGWPAEQFRITLQAVFLPASLCVMVFHMLHGLWTTSVVTMLAFSLPLLIAAGVAGKKLNQLLSGANFSRAVFLLLFVVGCTLAITVVVDFV